MKKGPVVFMDSGLGGLSHCPDFLASSSAEELIYFADAANFPYGPRSRSEIQEIMRANILGVLSFLARREDTYPPELFVIACNTASISALDALRKDFPELSFVGTVPAVKPAVLYAPESPVGVIATERTLADPYIWTLVEQHAEGARIHPVVATELVDFVEKHLFKANDYERLKAVAPFMDSCLAANCRAIVLACTHFVFLAEDFAKLAGDRARIFDSRAGVARRAAEIYAGLKGRGAEGSEKKTAQYIESSFKSKSSIEPSRRSLLESLNFSSFKTVPPFYSSGKKEEL